MWVTTKCCYLVSHNVSRHLRAQDPEPIWQPSNHTGLYSPHTQFKIDSWLLFKFHSKVSNCRRFGLATFPVAHHKHQLSTSQYLMTWEFFLPPFPESSPPPKETGLRAWFAILQTNLQKKSSICIDSTEEWEKTLCPTVKVDRGINFVSGKN